MLKSTNMYPYFQEDFETLMKNRSDHLKAACKKNKMAASSVNAYNLYVLKVGIEKGLKINRR